MTSQINSNNIDGNYPVAGQPNNTQGMRDNFTATKTNFQYAADEINDLQSKAVLKSALTGSVINNNMNDNLLYAVQLSDVSYKEVQQTATSGTITLDYSAAMYQSIPSVSGNISLAFTNWPSSGTVGSLNFAIVVSNTSYTLTLPATVSVGITTVDGLSPGTVGVTNTITFPANGTYVYVLETADGGSTISIENTIRPSNTYSGVVNISNTTPSTSTTSGALIVAGGTGVSGNIRSGGAILSSSASGGIGYTTGAGAANTQATNRATSTTVNAVTGNVTLYTAAGNTTPTTFRLLNSSIAANDVLILNQKTGTNIYNLHVSNVAAGSANITVWTTGGTTSEGPVINFAVIKGATT
jgi:hypothetical protein